MEPRPASDLRCAYCHDPAGPSAATCPGCRTVVHEDCRTLHGGCPTLGCVPPPASPPRSGPSPIGRAAGAAVALLGGMGVSLVLFDAGAPVWGALVVMVGLGIAVELLWPQQVRDPRPPCRTAEDVAARIEAVDGWLLLSEARAVLELIARRRPPPDDVDLFIQALARAQVGKPFEHTAPARDDEVPCVLRALTRAARAEWADAERELTGLLDRGSKSAAVWLARARVRRCQGHLDGALADADEACARAAADDPWAHEVRGRLLLLRGDVDGGLASLDEAVRRAPRRPWPRLARGVARVLFRGERGPAAFDLQVARARPGAEALAVLWRHALIGEDVVGAKELGSLDADAALALAGEPEATQRVLASKSPARARRAHALLGVAAERRGDAAPAASHAAAVRALSDDGGLESDWAIARGHAPAELAG